MRRVKKILAVGVIVLVGCGIGAYVFREKVFMTVLGVMLRPGEAFDSAKAPPAPDYSDAGNWAALPDKEDASDWLPPGYVEVDNPLREQVDVFYIHPTGFFGTKNWNAKMGERSTPGIPTEAMLASQASAFNGAGKVYAPEYRQATLYSFIEGEREPGKLNGKQALDLAYEDVARAFDYFIANYSRGRPFILASHSQGTCHALRLVAEKIDGTDLHARMIAAYLVGFGMPMDYFEKLYKTVKPGTSPTQTGCIVTWETWREGVTPGIGSFHRYPSGWEESKGKKRFGVNPLTWTTDAARAPASLNLGALITDMGGLEEPTLTPDLLKSVEPAQTWAELKDGAVFVKDLAGTPFVTVMSTGGNYHLFDFHLFWVNIRQNAVARAQAWFEEQAAVLAPASVPGQV